MTDLKTQRPPYIPTGRPVRRFVAALVVLAVLFGALWWSGLAAPRLSVGDGSDGMYNAATGRTTAKLSLSNRGPVAVEVGRVTLGGGVSVTSVRVNGRDVVTSAQTVAGGGTATMDIEFTCSPTDSMPPQAPDSSRVRLAITAKTPIGLERTRVAGTVSVSPACPG